MPPLGVPPARPPAVGDLFAVVSLHVTEGGGLVLVLVRREEDQAGLRSLVLVHVAECYTAGIFGPLGGGRSESIIYPVEPRDRR